MDICGYRKLQSRILFSEDGQVPETPLCLDDREQDALFDRLSRCWDLVETCPITGGTLAVRPTPTSTEKWSGLKRWFQSHHLFILELALTGHCLAEAVRQSTDPHQAKLWANLASRLRKGCGALFLYGIDFQPCSEIYCDAIRSSMPPAFSGFWIRERQQGFQPALVRFLRTFSLDTADKFNSSPGNNWTIADERYHKLHLDSMYAAVPDGKSLASQYRQETGKPHRIKDEEFRQYDSWFCIDRGAGVDRLDYVFQCCDLIERAVADLMTGHRLEPSVVMDLLGGLKAAIVVFGEWAGPVPERSRFYPKCLRGE